MLYALLAQADPGSALPALADRIGFAAVGACLIWYIIKQHSAMMERVGPLLERTAIVLDRVSKLLDDLERRERERSS